MNKAQFFCLLLSCTFAAAQAQDSAEGTRYRYEHYLDLAISAKPDQGSVAAAWSHLHGIGPKKRFKIGYGLRFTSFIGANQFYTTAPSKYTSPIQGPGTIASRTIESNIDTIAIVSPQVNALNIALHIQYTIKKRLDIGFNIDAAGFSFGKKQQVNILSSTFDPGQAPVVYARPTTWNLLLTSDNDIGSLNSEFYLRYWFSKNVAVKAGYTFLFTEYTTDNVLSFNNGTIQNDRYRLKSGMVMLSVSWRPWTNN